MEFEQDCRNVIDSHILCLLSFRNNTSIARLLFNDIDLTDNTIDKKYIINLGSGNNDSTTKIQSGESVLNNRIDNIRNVARNHHRKVNNNMNTNWNNNGNNKETNNESDSDSESEEKMNDNLLFHTMDDFEDYLTTMGVINVKPSK